MSALGKICIIDIAYMLSPLSLCVLAYGRRSCDNTFEPRRIKPIITPHYFRHNYVTLLYESSVDPLIAMKIVGHTDYQTTANIYTHVRDEMLKKATVNMNEVFQQRTED